MIASIRHFKYMFSQGIFSGIDLLFDVQLAGRHLCRIFHDSGLGVVNTVDLTAW